MVFVVPGCGFQTPVESHFYPVTHITERVLYYADNIHVFDGVVYINGAKDFLRRKPKGSTLYNASMLHERVHAIRMNGFFGSIWYGIKYLFGNIGFMWQEESIAWYIEIKYKQSIGCYINAETHARRVSNYTNFWGSKMINYDNALIWVKAVISGAWKPDIPDGELMLYSAPREIR